jgi:hypothetical protein
MSDDWFACMKRGAFEDAWRISDADVRAVRVDEWKRPRHEQRIWDGSPLEGRRVLVRCYHGLGDTLQFVRYLPRLHRVASDLTVWMQPTLIPLLSNTPELGRLLPLHDGTPEVPFDVDVEIMELPHIFRTQLATIPDRVPYIEIPRPDRRPSPIRVGVVWTAGGWDDRRSIPFALLERLLDIPGVDFVPLQPVRTAAEAARFSLDSNALSIEERAEVMVGCDLVVSVDTMAAHLAGALAVRALVMLHADADWRWMNDRSDSPWYPTLGLVRQRIPGAWGPVIEEVRARVVDAAAQASSATRQAPTA